MKRQPPKTALNEYNQTAVLMMFQYNDCNVALDKVKEKFGYKTLNEAHKAINNGDFPVAVFRFRESQKAPWFIHIEDLAKYIDQQRADAEAEQASWTAPARKVA